MWNLPKEITCAIFTLDPTYHEIQKSLLYELELKSNLGLWRFYLKAISNPLFQQVELDELVYEIAMKKYEINREIMDRNKFDDYIWGTFLQT